MSARVATTSAAVDATHGLDAAGAVEDEGQVLLGLLVPAHERRPAPSASAPAGRSAARSKLPTTERWSAPRGASSIRPRRWASRAAKTRPTATASPWRRSQSGRRSKRRGLEGVGQGVAVVEEHPPAALALVGGHDRRLDGRAAGHLLLDGQVGRRPSGGVDPGRRTWRSRRARRPTRAAAAWRGSRCRTARPPGCQKAPTRFLPSGRLTPVLPPMAASTWASSEVATFT